MNIDNYVESVVLVWNKIKEKMMVDPQTQLVLTSLIITEWAKDLRTEEISKYRQNQAPKFDKKEDWTSMPMTDNQRETLELNDIPFTPETLKGQASELISKGIKEKGKAWKWPKRKFVNKNLMETVM